MIYDQPGVIGRYNNSLPITIMGVLINDMASTSYVTIIIGLNRRVRNLWKAPNENNEKFLESSNKIRKRNLNLRKRKLKIENANMIEN